MPITGATFARHMDLVALFIGLLLGLLLGVVGYARWARGSKSGTTALLREQHLQERADLEKRLNDLGRIGKNVNDAKESYERALGKLSEGPGNLIRQVELLKELGAKTNKALHPKLLERALEQPTDLLG